MEQHPPTVPAPTTAPLGPEDVPITVDQSALFDEATLRPESIHLGYRGPIACAAAGISYRQLDYWARTGLVEPSIRPAAGSGC